MIKKKTNSTPIGEGLVGGGVKEINSTVLNNQDLVLVLEKYKYQIAKMLTPDYTRPQILTDINPFIAPEPGIVVLQYADKSAGQYTLSVSINGITVCDNRAMNGNSTTVWFPLDKGDKYEWSGTGYLVSHYYPYKGFTN